MQNSASRGSHTHILIPSQIQAQDRLKTYVRLSPKKASLPSCRPKQPVAIQTTHFWTLHFKEKFVDAHFLLNDNKASLAKVNLLTTKLRLLFSTHLLAIKLHPPNCSPYEALHFSPTLVHAS